MNHDVPALLVKVGPSPQNHGCLGALRSLGRFGVPVYAMVEDRFTPCAVSRHLTGRFVVPTTGLEDPRDLTSTLLRLGRAIGRRAVAVPTDDESAVLLAEHAERLSEWFLLPPVPTALPRVLTSKDGLRRICTEHRVPTPRAHAPADRAELVALGRDLGYPLVLKNLEAYTRVRAPVVSHTTVVYDEAELLAVIGPRETPSVLMQEYIPAPDAEDWITHLYCGARGAPRAVFTGYKVRSWPVRSGATTRAWSWPNHRLAGLATDLCRRIGYSGLADLDWRFDRRDGLYKLVDFNPRLGAQSRLFESGEGIDAVRAMYLDLTGQQIPGGPQAHGRMFVVGQLDLLSATIGAWQERRFPSAVLPRRGTERAWLSWDDPLPAVVESVLFGGTVARRLTKPLREQKTPA
ncbi:MULTISPECIES: ATP-grasp domain-containing protein [unclassified Streptomyces]|uniref:carboxylate--amine ligase n=1 Tax=unclassified Streptomyces TaxID=2593676 RepID=UPI00225337C6|nr:MULTISPECIES: ATP-grasp domain-containing protein [unclassified Streptomyces]MCX5328559.1 ATP-grasp domain-containing protein [Streptomyces sp. NBC_00140]MCX5357966.1 ATP-grasp domain-containing protein [Streptomyces sp. NBC_00124]